MVSLFTIALCLPCVYHYDYGSEPDYPGVRWSDSERNLIFARWLNFSPPPLCNEKTFSSKPRSDFFEQSKGVGGHFVHICYTHMSHVYIYFLYLTLQNIWRHSTPPNSFAHSSPTHGAIPKAAVLHVQVGSHGSKPSLEPKLKAARY